MILVRKWAELGPVHVAPMRGGNTVDSEGTEAAQDTVHGPFESENQRETFVKQREHHAKNKQ